MDYSLLVEGRPKGKKKSKATVPRPDSKATIVRDEQFYRESGDTVFLVENTLFKIHRSYLTEREDSAFRNMFALPQPSLSNATPGVIDGADDEHPIILHDTSEEFHALCWVLYALPPEFQESSNNSRIPTYASLASITNKYGFRTLEAWSSNFLVSQCFSGSSPYPESCSQAMLERLLDLSICLVMTEFQAKLETIWLQRLKNKTVSIVLTLDVGERLSLRKFLGQAYYTAMLDICQRSSAPQADHHIPRLQFPPDLSSTHVSRIMHGLCSMMLLSDRFTQCMSEHRLGYGVMAYPEFQFARRSAVDVSGKLDAVIGKHNDFDRWSWKDISTLENIRNSFTLDLPNYFLDPDL